MRWRQTAGQVHKRLGLLLTLPVIGLCMAAAVQAWPGALDRLANPQRYATSGIERLQPGDYAAAVGARLRPGERIARLVMPRGATPVIVTAGRLFYLDPPTARVLDAAANDGGAVNGKWWVSGWRRAVVGLLGAALLLVTLSGVAAGKRAGRRRSLGRHRTLGLAATLPLAVLSVAGVRLALTDRGASPPAAAPRPAVATRLTVDDAVARATALRPGTVRAVDWPTERNPDWRVEIDPDNGAPLTVAVADDEGIAALARTPAAAPPWHRGDAALGTGWRIAIGLTGLLAALLTVSGLVITWRSRPTRLRPEAMLP